MTRTRCFVAIPLQSPASDAASRLLRNLSQQVENVRWVKPDKLHLTVKFLGDIDDRDLPEACDKLHLACAGIGTFRFHLQEVGTFPREGIPRVVWLGIRTESEALLTIHRRLDQSLQSLGVRREVRAFRPHLTLGRPTASLDRQSLEQVLKTIGVEPLAEMEVNQLQLVASFHDRHGSTYEVIDTVALA